MLWCVKIYLCFFYILRCKKIHIRRLTIRLTGDLCPQKRKSVTKKEHFDDNLQKKTSFCADWRLGTGFAFIYNISRKGEKR